jgi:hypothetical protein
MDVSAVDDAALEAGLTAIEAERGWSPRVV